MLPAEGRGLPVARLARGGPALAVLVVVAAVATLALGQSWGAWLDPIIDTGRDLYVPERIRSGARLYADVLYFYPPATPLLLAALTALTGSSLAAYVGIGLGIAAATAAALWCLVRPLAGPFAAGSALTLFASFNLAGVGGWGSNYLFPYAHAATLAMLFFLTAAALLSRHFFQAPRRWQLVAALALLLAASWTKLEYAAFGLLLVLFAVVVHRVRWTWLAGYLGVGAVSLGLAALVFGRQPLLANILPPSLLAGSAARLFYGSVTGAARPAASALGALRGALLVGVFVLLVAALDRELDRAGRASALRPDGRPLVLVLLGLLFVATGFLLAGDSFFRAWSLLLPVLLVFALRRPRQPLLFLTFVALCGVSRITLNLVPAWYGFVFTLPLYALVAYVLFAWLPERRLYSRRLALLWIPVVVVLAGRGLLMGRAHYAEASPVATARGTYRDVVPERGRAIQGLLGHLAAAPPRSLVVLPEGLAINYLARVPSPIPFHTFTPVEIAGEEDAVVAALARRPPEAVAIVSRDMREFGSRGFGVDYGQPIVRWLAAGYRLEATWGEPPWRVALFRPVAARPAP